MKANLHSRQLLKRLSVLSASASGFRGVTSRLSSLRPGSGLSNPVLHSYRPSSQCSKHSLSHHASVERLQQTMVAPTILEVERKFAPTVSSLESLNSNTGEPPFTSIIHQGDTSFEDTYYDTATDDLCKAGVWIRRRGEHWEAKIRVGGDYTNSAFEEASDIQEISTLLGGLLPGATLSASNGLQGGDLIETARFVSHRRRFLVDGSFTVVIDRTDFGHVVGEVELERQVMALAEEVEGSGDMVDVEYTKAQVIMNMDTEIDQFMQSYAWAFPPGKPVGKLSAYFALKQKLC